MDIVSGLFFLAFHENYNIKNRIYCMLFSGMVRYVLEHAGKFYENCKKNQEKKDSILNAIEKM